MYHRVYSPQGEMFEVPQVKLQELVLQHGWTQTKPTMAEPEPTPEPKPKKHRRYHKPEPEPVDEPSVEGEDTHRTD